MAIPIDYPGKSFIGGVEGDGITAAFCQRNVARAITYAYCLMRLKMKLAKNLP
jgi:hypothetical protein